MEIGKGKKVLISGASFAGLSTAYWMNKFGYQVTVIEIGIGLKKGGTPVNIRGNTVNIVREMGILDQITANRLNLELWEFKNADDVTEGSMQLQQDGAELPDVEFEIERDKLLDIMFQLVNKNIEIIFNDKITLVDETENEIQVDFKKAGKRSFDLLFGCDGTHSEIRKMCFGEESNYLHFLGQYFSITIVDKLLIKQNTAQLYNVPDKAVMLNAYNGKTDIIFGFRSDLEIPYDYRNEAEQRKIIMGQFEGQGWKTGELLQEVMKSKTFYFDQLCQIKMPAWTKGRVALVGDSAYCASPAAGMGGSLAIDGAAALADAVQKNKGDYKVAFQDYNTVFRPFIEEIQEEAVRFGLESLVPRTEEAIQKRNTAGF